MNDHDLFIEIFPIQTTVIPTLAVYLVEVEGDQSDPLGEKLAFQLNRAFSGNWVWVSDRLLTDSPVVPVQIDILLDQLRKRDPQRYGHLRAIVEDDDWKPTPYAQAQYVLYTSVRALEAPMRDILVKASIQGQRARIERQHLLRTWVVKQEPALSVSIRSQMIYNRNLQELIEERDDTQSVIGLQVIDRNAPDITGRVNAIRGVMADYREDLLQLAAAPAMRLALDGVSDTDQIVRVDVGAYEYDYPASMLNVAIRLTDADEARSFGIQPEASLRAMRMRPEQRAKLIQAVSDTLKAQGVIGNAYNSRNRSELFLTPDFTPNIVFAEGRVRAYRSESLSDDFLSAGVYRQHRRFRKGQPVRIGVINALEEPVDDFVEALRRQLEREFGFSIEMIRERKVRVVSEKNIESAVRVIEKEYPHVLLALLTSSAEDELDDDLMSRHLKSITMGKGIATQVIYPGMIHDPDMMPLVAMGLLARTGNTPYALTEPLDYADYVVGFDFVRERLTRGDRVAAISRIYRSDGQFVRYLMDSYELEHGVPVPASLLERLFPSDLFGESRTIIHHDGLLQAGVLALIVRRAVALKARLYPVEIMRPNAPYLYAIEQGKVSRPPWGSVFRMNDQEALVMASMADTDAIPQPLHLRLPPRAGLAIEQAAYSVLAWTMLHYGSMGHPRLPVTIQHSDDIAYWFARGMLPEQLEGDIPFWI